MSGQVEKPWTNGVLLIDKSKSESFQPVFCTHLHKEGNLWIEEWKVNSSKRELKLEKG